MKMKKTALPDIVYLGKESVKISTGLLNQVKAHKQKTGVTITAFIEQAIEQKLKTDKK